jgi:hypothetical protein
MCAQAARWWSLRTPARPGGRARRVDVVIWVQSDEREIGYYRQNAASLNGAGSLGMDSVAGATGFIPSGVHLSVRWARLPELPCSCHGLAARGDGRLRPAQRPLTARRRGIAVSPAIGHHRGYQRRAGEGAP